MQNKNQTEASGIAFSCPICTGGNLKFLFKKDEIPYRICVECSFIFSTPEHNANLKNKMDDFEASYLQYFDDKKSDDKNHAKMLAWINKVTGGNHPLLLDIGCGSGKFVKYLNGTGQLKAIGIEPSPALYHHFLSENNSFVQGTINDFLENNADINFDVITAFDVLEHIEDPVRFLRDINCLMHPTSCLFISLPDTGSFHRKIAGKRWHYFNKYHFSYFSKTTLQIAAAKAGLKLTDYSHQSRYFQSRYVIDYFKNFVLQKKSTYVSDKKGFMIPLNLYDNMYCVLKKVSGSF